VELLVFAGHKFKRPGPFHTTDGQISTLGSIFSAISRLHRRILMNLITVIHYHIHMSLWRFQDYGFRGQVHGRDNIFPKRYNV